LNLDPAVERDRVGCDAVRWQGETTLRARAHEEEPRGKQAAALLNRVRSAFTQAVKVVAGSNVSMQAVLPADTSGQLPDLVQCFTLIGTYQTAPLPLWRRCPFARYPGIAVVGA
jgi:hypothetical protein